MSRSPELSRKTRNVLGAGLFSLALLLTACGGSSDAANAPKTKDAGQTEPAKPAEPTLPTAEQYAKDKGGNVSQYPKGSEVQKQNVRFCKELGGTVSKLEAMSGDDSLLTCTLNGAEVELEGWSNRSDIYDATCKIAGGAIIRVAIEPGSEDTARACHMPGERTPS